MGYRHNALAASLRNGQSNIIGVIVPTVNRAFFSSVVKGIEEVAKEKGSNVLISQSHDKAENEVDIVQTLFNARVDGIIMSMGKNVHDYSHYKEIMDKGLGVVQFDRVSNDVPCNQVVLDDYTGAFTAVEHLIENGYRRIVHFTGPQHISIYRERHKGYKDALKKHGLDYNPDLIYESNMELEDGRQCTENLVKSRKKFDGIFTASDYSAVGAMQVLKEANIDVPNDVGIVGFGDEPFTGFTEPPLSTVRQFPIQMGHMAAEQLFEQLIGKPNRKKAQRKVLNPELVIRQSSTLKK